MVARDVVNNFCVISIPDLERQKCLALVVKRFCSGMLIIQKWVLTSRATILVKRWWKGR